MFPLSFANIPASLRAFLDNHVGDLVSIDFITVPTTTFRVLFVLIVLAHDRRRIVHFNVTEHPAAEWTAQPMAEAIGVCVIVRSPTP